MKMDIDNEENEVNEPETSYLPHTYSDNASTSFISSDSKNDTKNWNTVTKSNTTYMNKEVYISKNILMKILIIII